MTKFLKKKGVDLDISSLPDDAVIKHFELKDPGPYLVVDYSSEEEFTTED